MQTLIHLAFASLKRFEEGDSQPASLSGGQRPLLSCSAQTPPFSPAPHASLEFAHLSSTPYSPSPPSPTCPWLPPSLHPALPFVSRPLKQQKNNRQSISHTGNQSINSQSINSPSCTTNNHVGIDPRQASIQAHALESNIVPTVSVSGLG
jgi:hypothetical protein